MSDDITEEEAQKILRDFADSKETPHSFFTKVIQQGDSTKVGNLSDEELGLSSLPVRSYQELALFCKDICKDNSWGDFFRKSAEIQFASSLSKNGFLLRIAGTQRKEVADMTPEKKVNKGWFKKYKEQPISNY
jgi:hypothetical protein